MLIRIACASHYVVWEGSTSPTWEGAHATLQDAVVQWIATGTYQGVRNVQVNLDGAINGPNEQHFSVKNFNLLEELERLALAPQLAATPWGGSPPRPLCQKICYSDCTENCPLRPLGAPPARRGSRSRPPLRRPRPLRFERLRVPVWNP